MNLLLWTGLLVWSAGQSHGVLQRLTCPFQADHRGLSRVMCQPTSPKCCEGLQYDEISEGQSAFTVSVVRAPRGPGVYWCGVLTNGTVLIKLAEGYFYGSVSAYMWSLARWAVLPSTLALTVLIGCCSERRRRHADSTKVLEECDPI